MRRAAVALAVAVTFVALTTSPAFAYDSSNPANGDCVHCHGTGTVDSSRKGPHGGYTTGTQKCQSCHVTHGTSSFLLLPGPTIQATCETCHDGTGARAVYGVLQASGIVALGDPSPSGHRTEVTNEVPGGAADGGLATGAFNGGGNLTCTDCHSPHGDDANTVAPFVGDRLRDSSDTSAAVRATPTNRLLKRKPTGAKVASAEYGSQWCLSCHQGRMAQTPTAANHPAEDETSYTAGAAFVYDRLAVVDGLDTTTTVIGSLGGSNFGYVMPDLNGKEPGPARTAQQGTHRPICQQCHEDARNVGDFADAAQQGMVLSSDVDGKNEGFRPASEASETAAHAADPRNYYNPRFQTFPHEGVNSSLLMETGDDLCLNCHVK